MLVNVDNLYTAASSEAMRKAEIAALQETFQLNDLGPVEYTLGVRVRQNPSTHTTTLDQEQYILAIAKKFLGDQSPPRKRTVPCDSTIEDISPLAADDPEATKWRKPCLRLGGSLGWVANFTRMDLAYALNRCMRCSAGASEALYRRLISILEFAVATASRKLTAGRNADSSLRQLVVEEAADIRLDVFRPGDPITFVDTGGGPKAMQCSYTFLFGMPCVVRVSQLTSTALSVCESEWFGATTGATALQAMEPVLTFLDIEFGKPMLIFCDNKAAVMLSDSNHTTKRMRHVATRLAYLQEQVSEGRVALVHISTKGNIADLGTKPLPARTFHYLASFAWS
jgi:hypothetical protein